MSTHIDCHIYQRVKGTRLVPHCPSASFPIVLLSAFDGDECCSASSSCHSSDPFLISRTPVDGAANLKEVSQPLLYQRTGIPVGSVSCKFDAAVSLLFFDCRTDEPARRTDSFFFFKKKRETRAASHLVPTAVADETSVHLAAVPFGTFWPFSLRLPIRRHEANHKNLVV